MAAKIPHRPEPALPFDYNTALKGGAQANAGHQKGKSEESALFKNAIRLADERNQQRATKAKVRGSEKSVNERLLQIKKGSGLQAEHTTSKNQATMQAEVGTLARKQANTKAAQTASHAQTHNASTHEHGLDSTQINAKKRSNLADNDSQLLTDTQSAQNANQLNPESQTFAAGTIITDSLKRASQDMGHFESIQSACKFLEKMNADTSSKSWRFSLPGDELVKGVHMQQGKEGGWFITVAADTDHADTLNEHLDALVGALEKSGIHVSSVALS
ncbi:MAG: hypothetical protein V3U65_13500 [Granulosicoccaceae bacterium]